jgi:predicted nucleotidyltransferase
MEIAALQQQLGRYPEIVAAYLFGSVLTGKLTTMSDVDVALLLQDRVPLQRELSLSFDVMSDAQKIFHREADVKVLNRVTDLPFLHEVLSKGKLIYERDPAIHRDFVARTVIAYLDFKPLHEIAMRNYVRSLKRGKSHHHTSKKSMKL